MPPIQRQKPHAVKGLWLVGVSTTLWVGEMLYRASVRSQPSSSAATAGLPLPSAPHFLRLQLGRVPLVMP